MARRPLRRAVAWSLAWTLAGAFYLVLIDITDLPELIVGAGAAVIAATGFELARERDTAGGVLARLRWLGHLWWPIFKVPSDITIVSALALRQLVRPKAVNGSFRAVPFRCEEDQAHDMGRRALAESMGSFAPNTIIVGVDAERELIFGHQLHVSEGDEAIDVLRLGGQ